MSELKTPAMDVQAAFAAIMAKMQTMHDANMADIQSIKEDASKQTKALREDNKKIYKAVLDQAKQTRQQLEAMGERIGEKLDGIHADIESVHKVKFVGKAVLDTVENVNEVSAATELDLTVENIVPVSYTHLDVYKRQVYA